MAREHPQVWEAFCTLRRIDEETVRFLDSCDKEAAWGDGCTMYPQVSVTELNAGYLTAWFRAGAVRLRVLVAANDTPMWSLLRVESLQTKGKNAWHCDIHSFTPTDDPFFMAFEGTRMWRPVHLRAWMNAALAHRLAFEECTCGVVPT